MKADIVQKTIGEVEIIDLQGDFKGSLASRCLLSVQDRLKYQRNPYSVLFTTQYLESIDKQGASVIIESVKDAQKCAVVTRDTFAAELLMENPSSKLCVFENSDDGIFYLGKELVNGTEKNEFVEKRKFPRLTVALPAKTIVPLKNQKNLSVSMVVTNLTFTGLFAKFLDVQSEIEMRKNIDLFDLPLLDFKIRVSNRNFMNAKGKMVHLDLKNIGFGVEFYEMAEPSEWLLKRFLDGMIHQESSPNPIRSKEDRHE